MTWNPARSDGRVLTGLVVVYPQHCDTMGHLTVKEYSGFFDQASWFFFNSIGYCPSWRESRGLGWADVRNVTSYRAELRLGELAYILTSVTAVGTKSVTAQHEMLRANDDSVCATLDSVVVQFDLSARTAVPLDPAIKAAAKELFARRPAVPDLG
jgi:acyl-CoA thioester hydrolase